MGQWEPKATPEGKRCDASFLIPGVIGRQHYPNGHTRNAWTDTLTDGVQLVRKAHPVAAANGSAGA